MSLASWHAAALAESSRDRDHGFDGGWYVFPCRISATTEYSSYSLRSSSRSASSSDSRGRRLSSSGSSAYERRHLAVLGRIAWAFKRPGHPKTCPSFRFAILPLSTLRGRTSQLDVSSETCQRRRRRSRSPVCAGNSSSTLGMSFSANDCLDTARISLGLSERDSVPESSRAYDCRQHSNT
jgi:hypothetical protein